MQGLELTPLVGVEDLESHMSIEETYVLAATRRYLVLVGIGSRYKEVRRFVRADGEVPCPAGTLVSCVRGVKMVRRLPGVYGSLVPMSTCLCQDARGAVTSSADVLRQVSKSCVEFLAR